MASIKHYRSVQPTFAAHGPSSNDGQTFSFVTFQNPDELKQKGRQSQIRKHAKRDVDRVKAKRKRATIEPLQASILALATDSGKASPDNRLQPVSVSSKRDLAKALERYGDEVDDNVDESGSLGFLRPVGAGRGLVPFVGYPVRPTERMVLLFDYMMDVEKLYHRHIRMLWITIAMYDEDSFNITLAHASNLLAKHQGLGYFETEESIKYYTITVQAVSKRLQAPSESTSDGLIGTILGLACLDISYGNWRRWETHMKGIQRILLLRGGTHTINTSLEISMTAFWNDCAGSLILDKPPYLPRSTFLNPRVKLVKIEDKVRYKQAWNLTSMALSDIGDVLADLVTVADHAVSQGVGDSRSRKEAFVAHDLNPVVHGLASLPRLDIEDNTAVKTSHLKIREILRIAALLFASMIRELCSIAPTGIEENRARLTSLLSDTSTDWSAHVQLQAWVLTTAGAVTSENDSDLIERLCTIKKWLSVQ